MASESRPRQKSKRSSGSSKNSGSSSTPVAPGAAGGAPPSAEFDYARLSLRSAVTEFEDFAHQKIRVAQRLGREDDVAVLIEAFELGKSLFAEGKAGRS